jgi:hypothetical protein
MPNLTVLIGLPGSGKTTYIDNHFKDVRIFDDFQKDAKDNSSVFEKSRNYLPLVKAFIDGKDCVIADIAFCDPKNLTIVAESLKEIADVFELNIKVDYLFFKNDPQKCKINATDRGRFKHPDELKKIDELSKIYRIPSGATTLPVLIKNQ